MTNFWKLVNKIIHEADIVMEVLDARLIEETRNKEIEEKITKAGKQILYVITKCDLVEKEILEKQKKIIQPSIFISATKHYGTSMLLQKIMQIAKGEEVTVAVVGYPNVGKSSVINALRGRKSAGVSSISGYTTGLQKVRINKKVLLIDSPGVYAYLENDDLRFALVGSKDVNKIKDPELVALTVIEMFLKNERKKVLEEKYGITINEEDSEEILEKITIQKNKVKKGNEPDTQTMAKIIVRDWQEGKLR